MRVSRYLFTLAFFVNYHTAWSQGPAMYEVPSNGQILDIYLSEADIAQKKVAIWTSSKGDISQAIKVYIEGPAGLKGSVESKVQGQGSPAVILASNTGWENVKVKVGSGKPGISFGVGGASVAAATPIGHISSALLPPEVCSSLSAEELDQILDLYEQATGQRPTLEELCGDTPPSGGGGGGGGGGELPPPSEIPTSGALANGVLHKDTCAGNDKSTYLVRMDLSLLDINPAALVVGGKLRAGIYLNRFRGDMAATIKPVSEGRYHPKPLLLMSSLGYGSGDQRIKMIKFKRGKIKKERNVPINGYTFYRGQFLTLSVISSFLTGGRASFEVSNEDQAYSVCFRAVRTRQYVNGYNH